MLADLHDGDLDNIVARAEFREIKDKVTEEVRIVLMQESYWLTYISA